MKFIPDNYESPESIGARLFHMNLGALAGYSITESGIFLARYLDIIDMSYAFIITLTVIVNTITIAIIIYLLKKKTIQKSEEIIIFSFELVLFLILAAAGFYALGALSYLGLVFILIAVIVELPYCTFIETCHIAAGAIIVYLSVSLFNIGTKTAMEFLSGIYYVAAFIPAYILLLNVSRQINNQRKKINHDRHELEQMNSRLRSSNIRLRRSQELTLSELDLASAVQSAFLPATPQSLEDWDIALTFKPCFGVSGDFYDFYCRDNILKGLTIYDVSGHGVSSALLTMIVKPAVAGAFNDMESEPLNKIISSINKTLSSLFCDIDHFLTAILIRIDGNRVEYTNAGHPDMILRDGGTGETTLVARDRVPFKGEPLGIDCREKPYYTEEFSVKSGDMILLYTDCFLEASDNEGELYGETRLIRSFKNAPASSAREALDFLMQEFNAFSRVDDVLDDLTAIVLRKK
jgi:serine phosphatase RsbU (regulator of sigma subunit)